MPARSFILILSLGASAAFAQQQPPAPAPNPPEAKKQSHLSERQAERVDERQRLIECNRQARDKQMAGADRREFTRECLKGNHAAVGGGQQK